MEPGLRRSAEAPLRPSGPKQVAARLHMGTWTHLNHLLYWVRRGNKIQCENTTIPELDPFRIKSAMKFDPELFKKLGNFERARYTERVRKSDVSEADILPYFLENEKTLGALHLECLLMILGSVKSAAANRAIANYLEHTDLSVRFTAAQIIGQMEAVDEKIMPLVIASLRKYKNDRWSFELQLLPVLDRPANAESARIASEFKNELG
jgi:hypothetical protein